MVCLIIITHVKLLNMNFFININTDHVKALFFQAWAKIIMWFNTVCGAIKSSLIALLTDYTSSWITSSTIHAISEGVSFLTTAFIFILIFVFIWKFIGTVITKIIDVIFLKGGDGIMYLTKTIIHRIFSSVAWIFSSIANGIKKVLFG